MLKLRSYQQFTRLLAGLLFFVSIYPYVAHACEMAGMASGHEQGVCCCAEAVNREEQQNETSHHGHHAPDVTDMPVNHGHHGGDGSTGMEAAHRPAQHVDAAVQHSQTEHTVPCDEDGTASLDDQTLSFEGDTCCDTVVQAAEVEAIVRYKASFLPEVSVAIRYADGLSSLVSLVPAGVNLIFKGIPYPATTRLYLTFRSLLN